MVEWTDARDESSRLHRRELANPFARGLWSAATSRLGSAPELASRGRAFPRTPSLPVHHPVIPAPSCLVPRDRLAPSVHNHARCAALLGGVLLLGLGRGRGRLPDAP